MKKFFIAFFLVIIAILLYGFFVEPNDFKVIERSITFDNLPESFDGFKIIQISDLLYGSTKNIEDVKNIVNKINELKADIIVFTGDLISNKDEVSENDIGLLKEELAKLDCNLYKYAVIGDNDQEKLDNFIDIMEDSEFIILDNESTLLFYKDKTPIKITGITNTDYIDKSFETDEEIESNFNLVLTHFPDYLDTFADYDASLVLAGHSLKGQVRLPFIGGIIKKDNARTYIDDYYKIDNTVMYVSGGLGCEYMNMRLFNKPEINLYRINTK